MKQTRKSKLIAAQGADITEGARGFFQLTGVSPTTLLDHFQAMSDFRQRKYNFFWELLKSNKPIHGMLTAKQDSNGLPYVWVVLGQLRGKQEFKIYLLSTGLLDYLIGYQNGTVSVKFTLQELLDEAAKLENDQLSTNQQSV